jgi:hypothetical protein
MSIKPQSINSLIAKPGMNSGADSESGAIESSATTFDAGNPAVSLFTSAASPGFQAAVQAEPALYGVFSEVSSVVPAAVPSAVAPTTTASTLNATGTGATNTSAVPSWVSTLQTASIKADIVGTIASVRYWSLFSSNF